MGNNDNTIPKETSNNIASKRLLRLPEIIGQSEVTERQAKLNRLAGTGPKRPRKKYVALVPVSRATWLRGVADGRYPQPIKLSPSVVVWRAEDIVALLDMPQLANSH